MPLIRIFASAGLISSAEWMASDTCSRSVRVDDQRLFELSRGPGEAAQDQGTLLVLSRRDVLLGHEIHTVVQRSDQAEVSGLVEGPDVIVRVMGLQKDQGLPFTIAEASIDPFGFCFQRRGQIPILRNASPARRPKLDERQLASIARVVVQEPFERSKSLHQAFGVVKPIDTNPEIRRPHAEPLEQLCFQAFAVGN